MENKQTAVQFLIEHIKIDAIYEAKTIDEWVNVFEKAKAIEKEQIEVAFNESRKIQDSDEISITHDWNNAEQYYEETYGK